MRLVADESCDFSIVIGVRFAGHDVVSITETMPGVDDETVIELARSERRLLLTEDKDFGQLVFAATKENSGVILIRYPTFARSTLTAAVTKLLADRGDALYSKFAVLEPAACALLSSFCNSPLSNPVVPAGCLLFV
jgi:predicted nuclease of predicted toxin-antitoxin system